MTAFVCFRRPSRPWLPLTWLSLVAALLLAPRPAAAQMTSGNYVGDGTTGRKITGLGFKPDVVLIKGDDQDLVTPTNTATMLRTSTMAGANSKPMVNDNALVGNNITSLDVDGFTVGNDRRVNQNGTTFFWAAFKTDADLKVGTYTGNGGTQSITAPGFSPDYLIVVSEGAARAIMACSATPAGRTFEFNSNVWFPTLITSLDPTGFSVGRNATYPYSNESGVVYDYVAWNAAPLKTYVNFYNGNAVDNRNITGVGFQPDYLIVKPIYNNDAAFGPTFTPPASQRFASMVGDSMYNFTAGPATNHIQGFLTDGFQIGNATSINRQFVDCDEDGGVGCAYFYIAFNAVSSNAPSVAATQTGNNITITNPNSFEVTFDSSYGGGIQNFYDLAEDPSRSQDLGGGLATATGVGVKTLLHVGILSGGTWYTPGDDTANSTDTFGRWNGSPPKLDLLETTSVRAKVRQEAYYSKLCDTQPTCTAATLAGVKGIGDFSVYPAGKLAFRWTQNILAPVAFTDRDVALGVYSECPPASACANLTAYSSSAQIAAGGSNPKYDTFLLAKREQAGTSGNPPVAGRKTDFLRIISQDWAPSDKTGYDENVSFLDWRDFSPVTSPLPVGSEVWNFLDYVKPTNLGAGASPWLDPAVTSRAADYRSSDTLTVTVGTGWTDLSENTAGADLFNESEAAYTLNLNTTAGLTFDIHGATTTRYSPFFKIRQWHSMGGPPSVTLTPPGTTLVANVDYRAAVKPVSRAHFANKLQWHSTLQNTTTAVTAPDVGTAGTVTGGAAAAARYGNGFQVSAGTDYVSIPIANFDLAKGAFEFWFQPSYASNDGTAHNIAGVFSSANNQFLLVRSGANDLLFQIVAGGVTSIYTVSGAPAANPQFSWRANDWVHIRLEWDDSVVCGATCPGQQRILINGVEPPHSDPTADYVAANLALGGLPFNIGRQRIGGPNVFSPGIYDEVYVYGASSATPAPLANGGLIGSANEYLADPTDPAKNYTLAFTGVDANRAGQYFYLGSDSKVRGFNVALQQAGTGVTAADLLWEYWNGSAWTDLKAAVVGAGGAFTDETNGFTKVAGTVYWTADPPTWSAYSVNGGPDLYYARVHLANGKLYGTPPIESGIKTDILLFQYAADITATETFAFAPPITTAVTLESFSASGLDLAVDLSWTTASELSNLGFHLYRADSAEGPYTRITTALIPGLGSSATGQSYSYRDVGLVNGQTYFYELEDVETTGKTELHGPVSGAPSPTTTGGDTCCSSAPLPPPPGVPYGDPSGVVLREVERAAGYVVVELLTPGFYAAATDDGRAKLSIPGFASMGQPGDPEIPVRRALLDAAAGKRIRLAAVQASDVVRFPGLRPTIQGLSAVEVTLDGSVIPSQQAVGEGPSFSQLFPGAAAGLLGTSFLGETKKAEVTLSPLRWDGTQLELSRRLLVRLEFSGTESAETSLGGSRGRRAVPRSSSRSRGVVAQLVVKERGLYRVAYEDVFTDRASARGRDSGPGVSVTNLRLSRRGEAVAFHVEPNADRFGPGSSLYFLSEGASLNPYGDAVYELEANTPGLPMPVQRVSGSGLPVLEYVQTLEQEQNHYYQAGLLDAPDLWLWDLLVSPISKSYPFTLDHVSSSAAGLSVFLQGASDFEGVVDHHVRVRVNGTLVGEVSWDGKLPRKMDLDVPAGLLQEGTNSLEIENVGDTGASYSMVFLNRFSVSYPRTLVASGGTLEGRFGSTGQAEVQGLSSFSVLIDTTDLPRWLKGATPTTSGLVFPVEAGRSYLATSTFLHPEVRGLLGSTLKSVDNRADYLLLAPKAFLEAAQPLLELRQSQGLLTKAVALEEVYEQFGQGEVSPEAIKEFVEYAWHNWTAPSPQYVLLLGDASYDPKDFLKTGVKNWVPGFPVRTSYLWTVSDPAYASVNGADLLPDLAIGRLPASSVEQARSLVSKVLAFEAGAGSFGGRAVLVADNADAAGNFEADADNVASELLTGRNPEKIYYSELGAGTRQRIKDAFDQGSSFLSYVGHGGTVVWASENIFNYQDVATLAPQPQQPLLLTMNCLNGFFHFPPMNSLSEALLKAEGKGVIAAFSPSGLSVDDAAHIYHKAVLREILSGQHERLGDALLAAQKDYADSGAFPELLSIYHLFGDPALRIR